MSPDGPKIVSPEEKLLKLIRGKGAPAAGEAPQAPPPARGPTGPTGPKTLLPSWWLTAVNTTLGALLGAEVIVWMVIATKPEPFVEIPVPSPQSSQETPATSGGSSSAEPLPSLVSAAARPLFQLVTAPSTPQESSKPSEEAKTLAARLTLLGIVAGDPAQAIIEDAQTKKTFFVTVGQPVVEGLIVRDIRENRVVLDLSGETIELSL